GIRPGRLRPDCDGGGTPRKAQQFASVYHHDTSPLRIAAITRLDALQGLPAHRTPHSITSSASATNLSGISRPSALAVFALMTNSNLVGCNPGRSAGASPRRMRPT